jgi:phosphoglycolate phosphatase
MIQPHCNICGAGDFREFNNRAGAQCTSCSSLERHRLVRYALESLGYLLPGTTRANVRLFHLAPEPVTHRYLSAEYAAGYICADLNPELYPHAECLRLRLPEDLRIFPPGYFQLILHNHVLEHIPGDFRDHLPAFTTLLKGRGHMVFTIPLSRSRPATVQFGELLSGDEERLRLHGQRDHFKSFGADFLEWFQSVPGHFQVMQIPQSVRAAVSAPYDDVYVYRKA